jgi:hypothetical protein
LDISTQTCPLIIKSAIEINEAPATTPLGKLILICSEDEAAAMLETARKFLPQAVPTIDTALEAGTEE